MFGGFDIGKFVSRSLGVGESTLPSLVATVGSAALGQPTLAASFGTQAIAQEAARKSGTQQGQSVAVSQATQTQPQETQQSGTISGAPGGTFFPTQQAPMQAGFGLAAPLTQLARKYAPEIITGLGFGAAGAAAPMLLDSFGQPKKMRVTRKMQRTLKQVVDQFGIEGAMELTGLDQNTIMFIYTKKFRNDGAYVTKAAVRKTRQTVRKMKNLCDMYDDLRPAAKRRAPVRRTGMTKITQVK
jgi:hypothetical protein